MTDKEKKILTLKNRINILENNKATQNTKCPGVLKKLRRQLRNAERE